MYNIYALKVVLQKYKNVELHEAVNGEEALDRLIENFNDNN